MKIDRARLSARDDLYAVKARARSGTEELGLRDRHKIDKLDRVTRAAQLLFGRNGYDGTTLRDIAREAGTALGTLSLYAADKRDLVLLLFNQNIPILLEIGRARVKRNGPLAENMLTYFEPVYRACSNNLTLYRIILNYGNLAANTTSLHTQQFNRTRIDLFDALTDIVLWARLTGECKADGDVELQARSFYYIHFAAIRRWISEPEPDVEAGLRELSALFQLHVNGFK